MQKVKNLLDSKIALVIGTALITTAVLCSYRFMRNSDGDILLEVAFGNLFGLLS